MYMVNHLIASIISLGLPVFLVAMASRAGALAIPLPVILASAVLIALVTLFIIFVRYSSFVLSRYNEVLFLRQDSATITLDLFLKLLRRFVKKSKLGRSRTLEDVSHYIDFLIKKRKQPMQIIKVDIQNIVERMQPLKNHQQILDHISYYIDFMAAYKKLARPRIVQQCLLYLESFKNNLDIVLIYGHSSVVIEAVVSGYREKPFTIVVVEDKQYAAYSLEEHKVVCDELRSNRIHFWLIKFGQIRQLLESSQNLCLQCQQGGDLTLSRGRRIHALIGCERVDTFGNTLVPADRSGRPSDTAALVSELDEYSVEKNNQSDCQTRLVVISESYKVRDYDKANDSETHVPLRGNTLASFSYIIGVQKQLPKMHYVSLHEINSASIFTHINELGIFPSINMSFDLSYCISVFEQETNLLGFFSNHFRLRYGLLDNIKGVLLDLNGVIIDDEQLHFHAFAKVMIDHDIIFSLDEYQKLCYGKSDMTGFESIKTVHDLPVCTRDLISQKQIAYKQLLKNSDLGIKKSLYLFLNELKTHGYLIGLVTASSKIEVDMVISRFQLAQFFNVIVTDDDVVESKPSPEGYLIAAEKLGVAAEKCLVVEDSIANIRMLSSLGMRAILISSNSDINAEAADIIQDFDDLLVV